MKQLLFTLLCLFALQFPVCAQQSISATSTAEACIAFIEQMANTRPDDDDKTYSYSFDGTTFIETNKKKSGESTSMYKRQYIDWEKFTKFSSETSEERVGVYFGFSSPISLLMEMGDNERMSYRVLHIMNGFPISLPVAQQSKIKELEMAANRLAQLAKSKASPLLEVSVPPDALKPLPTRSDTEDYILAKLSAYRSSTELVGFDLGFELGYSGFEMNSSWNTANMEPIKSMVLEYKDVKAINIVGDEFLFLGTTKVESIAAEPMTYTSITGNVMRYFVKSDMPQSEKDKLLKALKHWAWMKGADLVKDDLFGE
ncbi:hypothetical protein [Parapedobacter sp. DT-150]|uniref:hypothetical protein n=1 Tax=Parapedobacter sp. DT-150 TaxID=3396162 RepID=UPI003F1DAC7B